MSTGIIGRVANACIRRERFIKPFKHRGPKTGKDDRRGSYWRYNKRTASQYGYLSKDSSAFIEDPLLTPQFVVPNLKNFKLRAFVSAEITEEETVAPQPIEYLDTITLSSGSFK
jgi:hypothetical protein